MKPVRLLMAAAILCFGSGIGSAQLHDGYFSVPVMLAEDDEINMTIDFGVVPRIGDIIWDWVEVEGVDQNQTGGGSEVSEISEISGSEVFLFGSDGEFVVDLDADVQQGSEDEIEATSPCSGAIGDFVWWDYDRDGVQDADEPGVPAVGIELHTGDEGSRLISSTVTDVSGHYLFDGLCSGAYELRLQLDSLPEGSLVSIPSVEYDDSIDSD